MLRCTDNDKNKETKRERERQRERERDKGRDKHMIINDYMHVWPYMFRSDAKITKNYKTKKAAEVS